MHLQLSKSSFSFLCVALLFVSLSCRGNRQSGVSNVHDAQVATDDDKVLLQLEDAKPGLTILLSEGAQGGVKGHKQSVATTKQLAAKQVKQLLARVPALLAKKGDGKDFAFRERSLPPPRAGRSVTNEFPPKATNLSAPSVRGALQVTRYAPEGAVPIVPHLSVSFSQPMVAVTSHQESVREIPVRLSPQPKGKWRWVGTKTLLFDPAVRFPMATEYQVEIAKGTKSAKGEVLAKATKFSFVTPALTMKESYPKYEAQPLLPVIFTSFDQRIDPEAVLTSTRLRVATKVIEIRLASEDEIEADPRVKALVATQRKRDNGRRWLAFVPTKPLAKSSHVVVTIEKGTASAEGPLTTKTDQSFSFETFAPLQIVSSDCTWSSCPPGTGFSVTFNNPLDEEAYSATTVKVSPELAGYDSHVRSNTLIVKGRTLGRSTYTLTVPVSLKDRFGQTLAKAETREFTTGDARPQLFANSGLTVADPSAKTPTYDVHSINIKSLSVAIYKVGLKDWETFGRFTRNNPRDPQPAPGRKVWHKKLAVKGSMDRMSDTSIDLSPALNKAGKGHAVIVVEPATWPDAYKPRFVSWVQVTDIGLDAFTDLSEMTAWVTRLDTGKPLAGVAMEVSHTSKKAKSDAKGLATFALDHQGAKQGQHQVLVARKGGDMAFLPQSTYFWSNSSAFQGGSRSKQARWFVFDDRGMYKPGESVQVKGWIRTFEPSEGGDIGASVGIDQVTYKVRGPRGNVISEGQTKASALGGFDFRFALPDTVNLGHAYIELHARGKNLGLGGTNHGFQIQEFRRPEFEVSSAASQGPHIVGKGADITVDAKYYSGGPLAGADVSWSVSSSETNFTPPNQDGFEFGTWTPWWGWHRSGRASQNVAAETQKLSTKTDASGKQVLHMDFVSVKPPRPMSVRAEASVMDVNRQAWSTSTTLLVHPSELYVGLKREKYFVKMGSPIKMQGVIVDQEGKPSVGRKATVRAVRQVWQFQKGRYTEVEKDPQLCEVNSSQTPFDCRFSTPVGGKYKIIATVIDDLKRPNQSETTVWVSGGDLPPERNVRQEVATLIPDQKKYHAGDTAKILVQSPFFPAEAIVSIRRSGIVSSESRHMDKSTMTIEVPIREGHVPNLHVQVDLVGAAVRVDSAGQKQESLPRRPAYARGQITLQVPPVQRTLQVTVTPAHSKIDPASKTSLDVEVLDARGKAVAGAELTAFVVDEAVLALSGYKSPDPIEAMYQSRDAGGVDYHQRQWVKLAEPDVDTLAAAVTKASPSERGMDKEYAFADSSIEGNMARPEAAPVMMVGRSMRKKNKMSGGGGQAQSAIAVRKNFGALAVFAPELRTDAQGKATLGFKVPDNLTRYRIIVVAAARENEFGKGESSLTARKSLMLRPSPPRFLNFGDRFELPVLVQNQTDKAIDVEVAVRATNAKLTRQGLKVRVPANDRAEIRFPAAAQLAGVARFQVVASSGKHTDANEFSLPVWTPATTEAFASYGEIDKGAIAQPIRMPPDVVRDFGGLDISLSSTQVQALTDAFLYLVQYPYECSEQTASRIMGVAALRDVLSAFQAEGMPSVAEVEATVARDIERLGTLQNWDGGFAFWLRGHESWPYISIHAAHALTRAKDKGYKVPEQMLTRSKQYLRDIEKHIPGFYGPKARNMLIAYALYVRKRMGDVDLKRARYLAALNLKKLSMESVGWLMTVLHGDPASKTLLQKMHRYLDNKVSETASAANWVDGYDDDAHLVLHSSRRADAVLLEALILEKESSDLIPKVVRGLLAHRKKGRWGNTQENVFVLQAMDSYFQKYEKVSPDFVARMWLGKQFAGEQEFRGRSTDREETHIPMRLLGAGKTEQDLVISKQGRGRLYYRIGMRYAPKDLAMPPADHGFAVERSYEAVDDPADVTKRKDGSWMVKAGARVRVRLSMVAENRRYHVALVDALPAGLEAMNASLAVTGTVPQDPGVQQSSGPFWWWRQTWFEHQNMRDERVEAFTSLLWAGVHTYTYVTRATTPGRFVVPPAKAEEMYSPETFGRSGSDVMIVQ